MIASFIIFFSLLVHAQTSGCLSGNCTSGMGTYLWETGDEYTGQWVDGVRSGLGCYDWADGSFYYGHFSSGMLEGEGLFFGTSESEDQFGIFHNNTLSEKKSDYASGCLFGDCFNGVGIFLWDSNDIYIGEWKDGRRTGYGRYDWADGSFYTGFLKDNLLHGEGYYQSADNEVMKGRFEEGRWVEEK